MILTLKAENCRVLLFLFYVDFSQEIISIIQTQSQRYVQCLDIFKRQLQYLFQPAANATCYSNNYYVCIYIGSRNCLYITAQLIKNDKCIYTAISNVCTTYYKYNYEQVNSVTATAAGTFSSSMRLYIRRVTDCRYYMIYSGRFSFHLAAASVYTDIHAHCFIINLVRKK